MPNQMSMDEKADALEKQQIEELGKKAIGKSLFIFSQMASKRWVMDLSKVRARLF